MLGCTDAVVRDVIDANALKVHLEVERERVIGRGVGRVWVIVEGFRMGRQRVICRLGGDGDGGGRSTRWGVRSKIGEGVVGIDSEELELHFVKCREAGVELRFKKVWVRSEDVGWRVK